MGRSGREPLGAGIREAARLTGTECPLYCVQLALILVTDKVKTSDNPENLPVKLHALFSLIYVRGN